MGKQIIFSIPENYFDKAVEIARRNNVSVHQLAKQLLIAYLQGSQHEAIPVKIEPIRFKAKKQLTCATCKQKIEPGEYAYYVKYRYEDGSEKYEIHHAFCWEYASDEALARAFTEKRKWQRIINALKKEAYALADAINEARAREKILAVVNEIQKVTVETSKKLQDLMKKIEHYHIFTGHSIQETWKFLEEMKKIVQEFNAEAGKLSMKVEEAGVAITLKIKKATKKPRE